MEEGEEVAGEDLSASHVIQQETDFHHAFMENEGYEMTDLIRLFVSAHADKLSLYVGQPPILHVQGEPNAVEGPAITFANAMSLLRQLTDTRQMREVHDRGLIDFVYTVPGLAKLRVQARLVRDEMQIELHRIVA